MERASFLSVVEQVGGLTPDEAERAIVATLETVSERITSNPVSPD